jgi:hypothetical protein
MEKDTKAFRAVYEASEIAGCLSNFSPAEDISTCVVHHHLPDNNSVPTILFAASRLPPAFKAETLSATSAPGRQTV